MATYTGLQLDLYFTWIVFDPRDHGHLDSLSALSLLIKHHLAAVPFESISLHYSKTHRLSLDPQDLFRKIMGTGRGGYCMEANTFFGTVLRSLGYELIATGGRVSHATGGRAGGGFMGWNHMVNLVKIDGQRYLVDVGFGGQNPCRPIPLTAAMSRELHGVGPQMIKVYQKTLEQHSDPDQKVWVYSHRENETSDWMDGYAFTETEFFADDFEVMNLSTMTLRQSYFVQALICVKILLDEDEKPVGQLILHNGEMKRKMHGQMETLQTFQKEQERAEALRYWFGIRLTEDDKKGIVGLPTELRG